ncbi:iron-sulfur cluster biosynthesis transcriptional regulator SufR [Dendronalium sp. ChiSLP03b]|uniref:iron-sulfur cluster biosynthesis transcriptional regulator SufR n=1 Tax=Dendronalium sp. ChiSLP03b TaxID=3075381 RepID=UPI002AD2F02A|nr:iron-sulfur cluster biosynthesis transcriptional regulator SufR [Dendronalium sp. ChiSLP03b]MDZ8208046.1 iron-sulfur cluster biosynthesis transcriptional regulator SufR [Dendronalium sp. ChiSLP03b]
MATTHQSSTKQDILEYLLKHSQATAFELSEVLDVSPQAIRRHLKDLEAEELVLYSPIVQGGMGRPQHVYQLSRQGRDRLQSPSGDRYGEFAVSLLDTLAETVGHDQFKSILQKQWERKAQEYCDRMGKGSLRERVENLVELRKAEGFMAEYHAVDLDDSSVGESPGDTLRDRFIFMEHNCAISNVAESFPTICGHELEMFAAILPDCTVERTHWIINGEHRCGYLVQARKQKSYE